MCLEIAIKKNKKKLVQTAQLLGIGNFYSF